MVICIIKRLLEDERDVKAGIYNRRYSQYLFHRNRLLELLIFIVLALILFFLFQPEL